MSPKSILISRTDSIGDVVLTLPLAVALRQKYPDARICFLSARYTIPVVECCSAIDEIYDYSELENQQEKDQVQLLKSWDIEVVLHVFPRPNLARLMRKVGIPVRVGTSHRMYHWLNCNVRPSFTRKNAVGHESQLNFELVKTLFELDVPDLKHLGNQLQRNFIPVDQSDQLARFTQSNNVWIFHAKSQGSAREWPIEKYLELAQKAVRNGFTVLFTGTEKEGKQFRQRVPWQEQIIDTTGQLSLAELIRLMEQSIGVVACSTGPLHLAGALGKKTVGIYSHLRPIHPGRWQPLGDGGTIVSAREVCSCGTVKQCTCVQDTTVEAVEKALGWSV